MDDIFGKTNSLVTKLKKSNDERISNCTFNDEDMPPGFGPNQMMMNLCASSIAQYNSDRLDLALNRGAKQVYQEVDMTTMDRAEDMFRGVQRSQKHWALSMSEECDVFSQIEGGGGTMASLVSSNCYSDAVEKRGVRLKSLAKEAGISGLNVTLVPEHDVHEAAYKAAGGN